MADEHFAQQKDRLIYLVNNFEFLVTELNRHNLKKCKSDISMIAKDLEYQMEMLITLYLTLNFEDLYKLSHKYTSDSHDDSSKKAKEDLVTKDTVSHLKAADLEQIGKDFLKTYKSKVEAIIKDIRNNISTSSFQLDSQRK